MGVNVIMKKQCKTCVYYGNCCGCRVCSDYYPIDGEYNDEMVDELIESNRKEFHDSWILYINSYND